MKPYTATSPHSALLERFVPELQTWMLLGPVLDLACGDGRNGSFLIEQGLSVTFADRQQEKLDSIATQTASSESVDLWHVDFEQPGSTPLAGKTFGAILVFRYLHRPLLPSIKAAIAPGGLIIYETFSRDQPRFGRPSNPDYLLQPDELNTGFRGWHQLHSYEGIAVSETNGREQCITQLVARKPA